MAHFYGAGEANKKTRGEMRKSDRIDVKRKWKIVRKVERTSRVCCCCWTTRDECRSTWANKYIEWQPGQYFNFSTFWNVSYMKQKHEPRADDSRHKTKLHRHNKGKRNSKTLNTVPLKCRVNQFFCVCARASEEKFQFWVFETHRRLSTCLLKLNLAASLAVNSQLNEIMLFWHVIPAGKLNCWPSSSSILPQD